MVNCKCKSVNELRVDVLSSSEPKRECSGLETILREGSPRLRYNQGDLSNPSVKTLMQRPPSGGLLTLGMTRDLDEA